VTTKPTIQKKTKKKFNLLATNRKSKHVVGCLRPKEGHVFVSSDCFHPDCEYLTQRGWVPVLDLLDSDLVWQVDKASLNGGFVKPLMVIKKEYCGDLIEFSTVRGSLKVTKGHGMFAVGQMTNKNRADKRLSRFEWAAGDPIPNKGANWCCFSNSSSSEACLYSPEDIWRVCALQADSHYIEERDRYKIEVRKQRKIDKLIELFVAGRECTRKDNGKSSVVWSYVCYHHPLLSGKDINIEKLHPKQIEEFLTALAFFDGSWARTNNGRKGNGRVNWCTTNKKLADRIQAYMVTHGYECRISVTHRQNGNHKELYNLYIKKEGTIRCLNGNGGHNPERKSKFTTETVTHYDGMVGCVTVPSGFLLIRHNGQCFVTHNCTAGEPTILLNLCDDPTLKGVLFDYRGKRPEWQNGLLMTDSLYVTLMSGTEVLGPLLKTLPEEWYNMWVTDNEKAKGWDKEFKRAYKIAKIATLALIYGLTPAGLVRQFAENGLTLSLDDAKRIYSQFWASIKYASKLKEKLVKDFEKAYKSKRALMSPFMFPLPTGKPKDALNRNVQSSISSFLRFLWRKLFPNALGVTLVCVVHDELVVECRKDLVEEYRNLFYEKLAELNSELYLKYPMAMGFSEGKTFYDIH
jgi:hypothetical protein